MIRRKQKAVWVTSSGTEFENRADAVEAETREVLVKVLGGLEVYGGIGTSPTEIARHLLRSPLLHIISISGAKK